MGSSVDVRAGWGFAFGAPFEDDDYPVVLIDPDDRDPEAPDADAEYLTYGDENTWLNELFAFTEPPPELPDDWFTLPGEARNEWARTQASPWQARHDAAVPVVLEHYGTERYDATALLLRRHAWAPDCGAHSVAPEVLAPPAPDEVAALNRVAHRLRAWPEDEVRQPEFLLLPSYG